MKTLDGWQYALGLLDKRLGWREQPLRLNGEWLVPEIMTKLALIHTEVSEAVEALREGKIDTVLENGKPEGLGIELADVLIRTINLLDQLGFHAEDVVSMKHEYNFKRDYKHGGKLA